MVSKSYIKQLLTGILFLFLYDAYCQKCSDDFVYLNDGSKIRGKILLEDSFKLQIKLNNNSIDSINYIDVLYYLIDGKKGIPGFNDLRFQNKGFQSQIEGIFGYSSFNHASSSLQFINGYKFRKRYFVGVGIGGTIHHFYQNNREINENHKSFPILFRFSTDIKINKSTNYLFTDIGSQLENPYLEKMYKPIFFSAGIGRKRIIKGSICYIALSYSYKKARNYFTSWNPTTGEHNGTYSKWGNANTLEFRFGFQFN